jgi:hypothetical protein
VPPAAPTITLTRGPTDCFCVARRAPPGGNLEALRDVDEGGKASAVDRSATVTLEALEASSGSCLGGGRSNPTTVNLFNENDDGDVVFIGNKKGFICTAGQKSHAKFGVLRDQSPAGIGRENLLSSKTMQADTTQ